MIGLKPDLITLGKYLGAGFSFGAFGGRADIMDLMNPTKPGALPHAGTFNNNVFSMSAGFVGLSEVFTPSRAETLYAVGETLRESLDALGRACSSDVQFTGMGSAMNIHFVGGRIEGPKDLVGESKDLIKLFHFDLMESGIYAARRGQINLSLAMTNEDLLLITDAVAKFFERRRPLIRAIAGQN